MGAGSIIELISRGKQDIPIIGNPQFSFFKSVYQRPTNFVIEPIPNYFNETPDFGTRCTSFISRKADLLHKLYLVIELPALAYSVSWINGVGNHIIRSVELQIGGISIDKLAGQSLEIYHDMTVPIGVRNSYYDMIGKLYTYGINSQTDAQILYVPLPFWFCRDIGRSLPLLNLGFMEVSVIVEFQVFDRLWFRKPSDPDNPIPTPPANIHIRDAHLLGNYIYLDVHERRKLLATPQIEYLIEQFQEPAPIGILRSQPSITHNLFLNHCVKELIWFYRADYAVAINDGNNYANFIDPGTTLERLNEPLVTIELKYNGHDRFTVRHAKYFRTVQPFQHHSSSPDPYVYLFSFAYSPEILQPTGTCNFSKIDEIRLNIGLCPNIQPGLLHFIAINYNILRIQNGMAGLMFSS
jgi:hypothetical protein